MLVYTRWKVGGKSPKAEKAFSSVSASVPPWLDAEYSLCTGLFLALKGIKLNFTSLISHCHKEMKKKVYLEGGWYFKTFCRTSLETLGSLHAVKQFRCLSWQCFCKLYFIIALRLEVEMLPLTHRASLPLQVPFFWHVLFESPLRIYVLLQKYSTYFILPSEPETSL